MIGFVTQKDELTLAEVSFMGKEINMSSGVNSTGQIKAKSFRNLDKLCFALADFRNIHSRINIIQSHSCKKFL